MDHAGRASQPAAAPPPGAGDGGCPEGLGCGRAPAGVARRRPRNAVVRARRVVHGMRLALAAARQHAALGGQARWVAEGTLVPAAVGPDAIAACAPGDALHCHEKYRVAAVAGGTGFLETERDRLALRSGDAVVLAPGVRHRLLQQGQAPLVLLPVEFVAGSVLTAAEQPLLARVFAGRPVIHCAAAASAEAQSLLHRIRAEQRRGKAASVVAVRAYVMSLLVLLYRRRRHASGGQVLAAPDSPLRAARSHMEENFAEPMRVADLAEQAHLSVRQFTVRFKRAFGQTPLRYLTRLRVAAAQDLLCSTTMGVAEVARAVGYENVSHFYRTFVHHAGMSPGRYRSRPPDVPGTPEHPGAGSQPAI